MRNTALILLGIIVLSYVIFRSSWVQTKITQKVASYFSEELKTDIQIQGIDISWFLDVIVEDLSVLDQNQKNLLSIHKLILDYNSFDNKHRLLSLNQLHLVKPQLNMYMEKGDSVYNFQFIADYFKSSDTSSSEPMQIALNHLTIDNAHFEIHDNNEKPIQGQMDYFHIVCDSIFSNLSNIKLENGKLTVNIDDFSAQEKSGLKVKNLQTQFLLSDSLMQAESLGIEINHSKVYSSIQLDISNKNSWNYFMDSVLLEAQIDSAYVSTSDIAYFASETQGMDNDIKLSCKIKGPLNNFSAKKLYLRYGKTTQIEGKVYLSGIEHYEKAFMDAKFKKFTTSYADIHNFRLPGNSKIPLPEQINNLGAISLKGRFTGFYNDFVSDALIRTRLGNISTDLLLKPEGESHKFAYDGNISSENFKLGTFLGSGNINNLSFSGNIHGEGLDQDAEAKMNIDVKNIQIAKYTYKNTKIDGVLSHRNINGRIYTLDSIFMLNAEGSYNFSQELPTYKFTAKVQNARLGRLYLADNDSLGLISGLLNVDAKGSTIDNLRGNIHIDSLNYSRNQEQLYAGEININSSNNDSIRNISLRSSFIDGDIQGNFQFYDLAKVYTHILNNFIPSLIQGSPSEARLKRNQNIAENQNFNFNFNFKNTDEIFKVLYPQFELAPKSSLAGIFDIAHDSLNLDMNAKSIRWDNMTLRNFALDMQNHVDTFDIAIIASRLQFSDSLYFDSVRIHPSIFSDSAIIDLALGKQQDQDKQRLLFKGGIKVNSSESFTASVNQLNLWIKDSLWTLQKENLIRMKPHHLQVKDFELSSGSNALLLEGIVSDSIEDYLNLHFKNFRISFLNFLLENSMTEIDGLLNGSVAINRVWQSAGFRSQFNIQDFIFNKTYLGTAKFKGLWSKVKQAVVMDLKVFDGDEEWGRIIDANGFFYPDRADENYDIQIQTDGVPLYAVQPYVSSFSSAIEGFASGTVFLKGATNAPYFEGSLKTDISKLKIDYLNTSYSLHDNFEFHKNYFGFPNAQIFDNEYDGNNGHIGRMRLKLSHKNFSDLALDLRVKAKNMVMLNTTQKDNDIFYGYGIGDADVSIKGPVNNLNFIISAKPLLGTKLALPMTESSEVTSNDFITFLIKDSAKHFKLYPEKNLNPEYQMSLDLNFEMTPDAVVQMIMDETVGDIISAQGKGDIRILIDPLYNVDMYGTYEIEKGDYLFTMRNIINKHLYLEPGGSVKWDGDPYKAQLNLRAIYQTEAKLYDLFQMIDSSDVYKRRSKVNCIIDMQGELSAPDVKFDIEVPEEDNATQELLKMILYASGGEANQDIINKNFISLVMLSSFQAPSGFNAGANPNALASNATEALVSQMGHWINSMNNDIDVGFTWDPGDDVTSTEIAVALSYAAFNDRLLIDGKLGTGGENKTDGSSTRVVGDMLIEYKILKEGNLRAKVFNRTNYDDPLNPKAPYTQGAGIVYRKEFDSFAELFKKQVKKTQELQLEEPVPEPK